MFLHWSDRSAQLDAKRGSEVARFEVKNELGFSTENKLPDVEINMKQTLVFTAHHSP